MTGGDAEQAASELGERYRTVRETTLRLCAPLAIEDYVVQSMPDASPAKWHLAHTTWFFETLRARRAPRRLPPLRSAYGYLFNSYYEARRARGTRAAARAAVAADASTRGAARIARTSTRAMARAARRRAARATRASRRVVELGLHHEQQHQELILTDIKHVLVAQPARSPPTATARSTPREPPRAAAAGIARSTAALVDDRARRRRGFAFDNEAPRHRVSARAVRSSRRGSVDQRRVPARSSTTAATSAPSCGSPTAGRPCRRRAGTRPLYWERRRRRAGRCSRSTGCGRVDPDEPVCHVSYYEADARALGRRAPADRGRVGGRGREPPIAGNFVESGACTRAAPRVGAAARAAVRRRLGVDRERLLAVSRLPPADGRARRVQRQVHVQPDRAARRLLRHARAATSAPPTATSSRRTRAGSSAASAWRRSSPLHVNSSRP